MPTTARPSTYQTLDRHLATAAICLGLGFLDNIVWKEVERYGAMRDDEAILGEELQIINKTTR